MQGRRLGQGQMRREEWGCRGLCERVAGRFGLGWRCGSQGERKIGYLDGIRSDHLRGVWLWWGFWRMVM